MLQNSKYIVHYTLIDPLSFKSIYIKIPLNYPHLPPDPDRGGRHAAGMTTGGAR